MSKSPARVVALEGWSSNVTPAHRPSWIFRKITPSRPPITGAPSSRPRPDVPEILNEPPAILASLHPPPPGPVEIATTMALTQLADENAALRSEVAEMAAAMARLKREVLEASESELVQLALTIAERVVGRELATDPSLAVVWACEGIQTLAAKDVVIAVARDVAQRVPLAAWAAVDVQHREITDAQLKPGTIEIRATEGVVTTGADARLAAVAQALGVAGEP